MEDIDANAQSTERSTDAPESTTPAGQRKVVATAMIGSIVEWFDFLVYATVSGLVFGKLFFPNDSELVSTMLALSTFAVGYLARPLGGLVFAHLGDKYGRQQVLFATFILMGGATVLIGILPSYSTIGVAAPIILLFLRLIQGLGAGGEFGAAITMVVEHGNNSGKRGFYGALTSSGASGGFLLASGMLAILTGVLTDEQFESWGWRIPFLLSATLLVIGFYLRLRVEETPMMKESMETGDVVKTPLIELFRRYPRQIALATLVPTAILVSYQVVNVFSIPFIKDNTNDSTSYLFTMLTVGQVIYLASMVFSGWWSDHVGRRRPMMMGAAGLLVWGFAYFPLVLSGSVVGILCGMGISVLFTGFIFGPMATFMSELFGTDVRFTGISFAYQVNSAVVGGLTPLVAVGLSGAFDSWVPVAIMISVAAAISLIAIGFSGDNFRADLNDVDGSSKSPQERALTTD